jgi:hypothetical protein
MNGPVELNIFEIVLPSSKVAFKNKVKREKGGEKLSNKIGLFFKLLPKPSFP